MKSLPQPPSNYATAGSDFGDDLESLNHEPLPTSLSSRPYTSVAAPQHYITTVSQDYRPMTSQSYPTSVPQSYNSANHHPYNVSQSKPDIYHGISSLSLSETKPDGLADASYVPFSSGPSLTSTPGVQRANGYAFNPPAPQANHQVGIDRDYNRTGTQ